MRLPKTIHLFAVTAAAIWLTACGGGSKTPPTPPPVISVALSGTPPTSLVAAATTSLTATVSNDSSNAGVKWSVSCSASACGSFSPTSTASGAATTYTAPTVPPTNPATVTITATSVTDTTKAASTTITITPPALAISVAFNPAAPTSLVVSTTASLTAVVTNDSSNGGVKWTVTCGSSACGSFSPTSTASGTATTYTAPSTIPSPATVTVTATSVTDTTKTATATITITPIVLANGTYVYHVSGEDSTGPYFIAGAFTVQNGVIAGGEQDFTDRSVGYPQNTLAPATSKLSIAGNNIQIVLDTGNTNIGVSGLETLRGTRVSSSRYLISEFDNFAAASGSLDLQTGTAAPSGAYVFSIGGIDGQEDGLALAIGGVLSISGTTISNTASVFDINLGGNVNVSGNGGPGLLFSSGSVTAPDSFGRLTFSLTPSTTSVAAFILTGYIVGPNRIQLVESQVDSLNSDLGGTALAQTTPTGGFTTNTVGVSGATYVFSGTGVDRYGNQQIAGTFTLNADGTLSGSTIAVNDVNNYGTATVTTGTYTVDPTGRVSLVNILPTLPGGSNFPAVPFGFELYLDGNGNAMELGVDANDLTAGVAYLQTAPTAQLSGSYAVSGQGFGNFNNIPPAWSAVGSVSVTSNTVTGSTDYNLLGGAQTSSVSLTGTTNVSPPPPLVLTGLNAVSAQTANGYFYFPIDGTRFVAIDGDGQQLGLLALEGTSP